MLGTSRGSLTEVRAELYRRIDAGADAAGLGEELLAVARLLGGTGDLRRALADSGTPAQARAGLVRRVLEGRVTAPTLESVVDVATRRWSTPRDAVDAVEDLGALAAFAGAESAGSLDAVEDELYRLARITAGDDGLRRALGGDAVPLERRLALVQDLLGGRVAPLTLGLTEHAVRSPRGRRVDEVLTALADLAGTRHGRVHATAHVANALTPQQLTRLQAALARLYGRPATVSVVVDPALMGGVRLEVGDEVIDGSVAHRLTEARTRLTG